MILPIQQAIGLMCVKGELSLPVNAGASYPTGTLARSSCSVSTEKLSRSMIHLLRSSFLD